MLHNLPCCGPYFDDASNVCYCPSRGGRTFKRGLHHLRTERLLQYSSPRGIQLCILLEALIMRSFSDFNAGPVALAILLDILFFRLCLLDLPSVILFHVLHPDFIRRSLSQLFHGFRGWGPTYTVLEWARSQAEHYILQSQLRAKPFDASNRFLKPVHESLK